MKNLETKSPDNAVEKENLVGFEIEQFMKKHPPLGEDFSPEEELLKVRHLPKDEGKIAILGYEEKLERQREAIAECRVLLECSISRDNDIPKKELLSVFQVFSKAYGFSKNQQNLFENVTDSFYKEREKVKKIREEYPNDFDLVKNLVGMENLPKPEILRITAGPMSIDIATDSTTKTRLYRKDIEAESDTGLGGFAGTGVQDIFYTVEDFKRDEGHIQTHEREHVKNRFFQKLFENKNLEIEEDAMFDGFLHAKTKEEKLVFSEKYFHLAVLKAESRARDEIIAMKKEGRERNYEELFLGEKTKYDDYDYLSFEKNYLPAGSEDLWKEEKEKWITRYEKAIRGALDSFDSLMRSGYSTDEVIALLTDKPLSEWKTFSHHFLIQKERMEKGNEEN